MTEPDRPVSGERRKRRDSGPDRAERRRPARDVEGSLRDLVGAGPSQLGVSKALRGRDVNRPTEDDLAEAERELKIVRRHWKPRADHPDG